MCPRSFHPQSEWNKSVRGVYKPLHIHNTMNCTKISSWRTHWTRVDGSWCTLSRGHGVLRFINVGNIPKLWKVLSTLDASLSRNNRKTKNQIFVTLLFITALYNWHLCKSNLTGKADKLLYQISAQSTSVNQGLWKTDEIMCRKYAAEKTTTTNDLSTQPWLVDWVNTCCSIRYASNKLIPLT